MKTLVVKCLLALNAICPCMGQSNPDAIWTTVIITSVICGTILTISIVGMLLHFAWKSKEMKAQKEDSQKKWEQEKEALKNRQRADLLDKWLKSLESRKKTEDSAKLDENVCKEIEELLKSKFEEIDKEFKPANDNLNKKDGKK